MNWQYFILGIVAWQLAKILTLAINQTVIERRKKRLFKLVNVTFPDKESITFIATDASDRRAMQKLERQIRQSFDNIQGDLPEPILPDLGKRQS